jgi:two-component system phosphate regulon sensor histidine kinase PhoR
MRWGFRSKLILATLGLAVVSLVCADLFLSRALERDLTERIRADLQVRLALVERRVDGMRAPPDDLGPWDALADELGQVAQARVTIIALDGRVLGDSEVPLEGLTTLENHARRPEVIQALSGGGFGQSVRWSTTVSMRMIYAAVRFGRPGATMGVVRAALPLTTVEEAVVGLHRRIGLGSVLALVVALALSLLYAQIFGRSLVGITQAARQIAKGDLDVRIHAEATDEIGALADTLDHLAGSLSATMRELREERDRLGRILEAMEEGVLVVDADRIIVMANPAAHVLLMSVTDSPANPAARRAAHDGDNLAGRAFSEAARHPDIERILGKTLASHEPSSGEVAVDRPRPRRLLVHAAPLAGAPHGAVVVLVDVTEIRRLESIRKDFVANVSHELRTPLTAVRTAIETARSALKQDPQEADRFLEIADRHSERLTALVRDLLDLSRIESGHLTLRPSATAVEDLASEVITLFREPASRRKLRLAADFARDLPPAWVDRDALTQVVTNLVENAVKYTDEGGVVTLRGRGESGRVRLWVEDSGPGISPKHLPRIFERFYRVDAGRSRDRGGTGLGLSIVKHLVEAMHGTVNVDSELGRGSSFCVTLPTEPVTAGATPIAAAAQRA